MKKVLVPVLAVFIVMMFILNQCFSSKSTKVQSKESENPKEKVYNDSWDGSVRQVEDYLKNQYLRDPDSYKPIGWGKVAVLHSDNDVDDIIEIRNPKSGCKFYTDELHHILGDDSPFQKSETKLPLYVVDKKEGWIKYRMYEGKKYVNVDAMEYYWSQEKNTSFSSEGFRNKYFVWHQYRAKNGFGGMAEEKKGFYFDRNGNITDVKPM